MTSERPKVLPHVGALSGADAEGLFVELLADQP